jgi:hypothetical protein
MDLDKKTLLILVVVALVSLVVGGLVGYYAIPKSEGYSKYELQPTPAVLDLSNLGKLSNSFISQQYQGVASAGDAINRFSYSNQEARAGKNTSSGKEAYAAPSYGLVKFV